MFIKLTYKKVCINVIWVFIYRTWISNLWIWNILYDTSNIISNSKLKKWIPLFFLYIISFFFFIFIPCQTFFLNFYTTFIYTFFFSSSNCLCFSKMFVCCLLIKYRINFNNWCVEHAYILHYWWVNYRLSYMGVVFR